MGLKKDQFGMYVSRKKSTNPLVGGFILWAIFVCLVGVGGTAGIIWLIQNWPF